MDAKDGAAGAVRRSSPDAIAASAIFEYTVKITKNNSLGGFGLKLVRGAIL